MSTTGFARARTDEQRLERREAILATAATMLLTVRVNDLSLNELARRVGLAKSNVLRYFESREAVLLELYARENTAWLDAVESALAAAQTVDVDVVARAVAACAAERPVFCDLTASAASVLEHNVSADVAAAYKRDAIAGAYRLAEIVSEYLGEFSVATGTVFVGGVLLVIGGVWASSQPSAGMAAAYREHPELKDFRLDFTFAVSEIIATLLVGLQHREARNGTNA
ncbi:MAG TPA: TetR/AcrR family transcriptional regulator [Galbitalea sp.]|jgi:AcrR family transcriptional regulator